MAKNSSKKRTKTRRILVKTNSFIFWKKLDDLLSKLTDFFLIFKGIFSFRISVHSAIDFFTYTAAARRVVAAAAAPKSMAGQDALQ